MQGNYQEVREDRVQEERAPQVEDFQVGGHESRHTTQAMLASNNFNTGISSLNQYKVGLESKPEIVDLVLSNLPADTNA